MARVSASVLGPTTEVMTPSALPRMRGSVEMPGEAGVVAAEDRGRGGGPGKAGEGRQRHGPSESAIASCRGVRVIGFDCIGRFWSSVMAVHEPWTKALEKRGGPKPAPLTFGRLVLD